MERISTTYKYIINSPLKGSEIIDKKMIEKDCIKEIGGRITLCKDFDSTFVNYLGNVITRGLRLHKSGKICEFIVENSYEKDQKDKEQRLLTINND